MRTLSRTIRQGIRRSALYLLVLTTGQTSRETQAHLAYAAKLGKPIRILVARGVRLPEDAFFGIADCQVARGYGDDRDVQQVLAWVQEVKDREGGGA